MNSAIGSTTSPSTARIRSDVAGDQPASFRYNNPGAQYPSTKAALFGQTGYGVIGGGHKIARFPSPVNGAAANFDLLHRNYTGLTIGAAGRKWTGANGFGVPGYDPNSILTKQMLEDSASAISLLKAIAGRESGQGDNLSEDEWLQAHQMFKAGSADAYLGGPSMEREIRLDASAGTGAGLVRRAREHLGEEYRHVVVPKNDPGWTGPWDCAEFISWLVYQEAGVLYGCEGDGGNPATADAYTGAWKRDLDRFGLRVSVEQAAGTVGGILLRYPPGSGGMGHIVLCDGQGGTIEAKGRRYGVVAGTVQGRDWDAGILIPEINYEATRAIEVQPPAGIYKYGAPNMDPAIVSRIQRALLDNGYDPGATNGEFGLSTQAAVVDFQESEGLVVDGEVGPDTAGALGISLARDEPARQEIIPVRNVGGAMRQRETIDGRSAIRQAGLSARESSMDADQTRPGQPSDVQQLLLGLLLRVLSERQAAGASSGMIAERPAAWQPSRTVDDLLAILLPIVNERLGVKPAASHTVDQPRSPQQPAMSRPSVQLSIAGLGISSILQALGVIGTPFGLGAVPTTIGTLATLIPAVAGIFGASDGFGTLQSFARSVLGVAPAKP
ncbi:MAG TPA: peptidoglycan-binding domain-containing protein [Rhizobiaceae bacterium]|nr:peptidoglycan-binding domain-containing protein [Rhizobiaceae bacterium]